MSRKTIWTIGVLSAMLGLAIGSLATYLLLTGWRSNQTTVPEPSVREPRAELPPPKPPVADAPAGVGLEVEPIQPHPVLAQVGAPNAMMYHFRGGKVAYCVIRESNNYSAESGSLVGGVQSGIWNDGQEVTIALFDPTTSPAAGRRFDRWLTFSLSHSGKTAQGHAESHRSTFPVYLYNLLDRQENPIYLTGVTTSCRFVRQQISPQIGQHITLCQIGLEDLRPGLQKRKGLGIAGLLFADPFAEVREVPPIRDYDNNMARVTVQIMFLDVGWNRDSKEVKAFADEENVRKRLSGKPG
jgi:hypothetical protein